LSRTNPEEERRKWPRLPLAIPIFVRSRDENGKDLLEFATAMNVSAGGVLVAVRRSLPLAERVSLEIPTAPSLAVNAGTQASRHLLARTVRVIHAEGYHLVGLKFAHPLGGPNGRRPLPKRKAPALV
jgi:PilZ domain